MILIILYIFQIILMINMNGDKLVEHYHDNLKELNEKNTELYIYNKKYKYSKYFKPEKEGIYEIKLKFNINITDCSFLFSDCQNITNLDLSSFDTKNVINMSYMFSFCDNIKTIKMKKNLNGKIINELKDNNKIEIID